MKTFFAILFFIVTINSNDTIWRKYHYRISNLCSEYIYFYNDNFFYYSSGCEAKCYVKFGSYSKKGKYVFLNSNDTVPHELIESKLISTRSDSMGLVKIIATDRYGDFAPGCAFWTFSKGIPKNIKNDFFKEISTTSLDLPIKFNYRIGKEVYKIDFQRTDENGVLEIDPNQIDLIAPVVYFEINRTLDTIPITKFQNQIKITWSIPKEVFYNVNNKYFSYDIETKIHIDSLKQPR